MRALFAPIRRTFDFSGTTTRRNFWPYMTAYLAVTLALALLYAPGLPNRTDALLKTMAALTVLPLPALTVRRLHDANRSGLWALIFLLPSLGVLAAVIAGLFKSRATKDWPARASHRVAGLAVAAFGLFFLSRLLWSPFLSVSTHMQPAIDDGEYIVATTWDRTPHRGDIVVFRDANRPIDLFFRVTGLPGETIAMENGVPVLNGVRASQTRLGDHEEPFASPAPNRPRPLCANQPQPGGTCLKPLLRETWPDSTEFEVLDTLPTRFDNMATMTIPEGHIFVMGDHRDNSNDSRVPQSYGGPGLVPTEAIVGKVRFIATSFAGPWWDLSSWRWDRMFRVVN